MVNYHFLYKTFICDDDELSNELNVAGAEGWRLHTCEPVVIAGAEGIGSLRFVVVMDLGPITNQEPEAEPEDVPDFAAMSMK